MNYNFSVIIPLYNKRADIADTLRSVLAQSYPAHEIVVVDDGSTDGGGDVVRQIAGRNADGEPTPSRVPLSLLEWPRREGGRRSQLASTSPWLERQHEGPGAGGSSAADGGTGVACALPPYINLITQPNAGVCVARNRAMAEAKGEWFALLDADDQWEPDYLATIASLIDRYPGCGAYCTAFDIVGRGGRRTPSDSPATEGVVADYFREAMSHYVLIPSAAVLSREAVAAVGGFPEGMKLGEDQYMWTKLVAGGWRVAYSPLRMCRYSVVAANRSASSYIAEKTAFSFRDFYLEGDFWRNEYLAKCEINKAITISARGGDDYARGVERFYSYTKLSRRALRKLRLLNRLPRRWRPWLLAFYNRLAWALARKGL